MEVENEKQYEKPYADFIDKPVGDNQFFYSSFKLNQILTYIDVYVSIPKMKQHYKAGVTYSIKNQIGIVPIQFYMQNMWDGMRSKLHKEPDEWRLYLQIAS